jgi:hypothetical protein
MLGPAVPKNSRAGRFAAVIPVGPSAAERLRLIDLLASLWHHEPNLSRVVVIDDGAAMVDFPAGPCPIDRVISPREGRGNGILGGLCAGMLAGLKHCASFENEIDFVLKIDTDALVIAPFAAQVARLFHDHPTAGMAGAYRFTPNGDRRDFAPWRELANDLSSAWISDRTRQLRAGRRSPMALHGAPAAMRRAAQLALRNGYQPGENIQGGAYGLSIKAIREMNAASLLNEPLNWLNTALGEDVLVPMLVKAAGLELHDAAGNGDPFGVRYKGLPDTPAELISRGYAIIHSVKNDANFSEGEIREFFRMHRENNKLLFSPSFPKAV